MNTRWISCFASMIVVACFFAFGCSALHVSAQDAEPVAAANGGDSGDSPDQELQRSEESIGGMILSGGVLNIVFFGILGIFSVWAAAVVLERMFNLRRDKLLPSSFVESLRRTVQSGKASPEEFTRICEQTPAAVGRIFRAGVLRAGRSVSEVEKAMEDAASREMADLRTRSRPLSVVASVAPLVGLLGTVVGMILAFQISSQLGLGKAERLAEGIYLALMTTAAGLTIAIPCLLFASSFQTRAERFMCDIDETLMEAMPCFARWEGKVVGDAFAQQVPADGIGSSSHSSAPAGATA